MATEIFGTGEYHEKKLAKENKRRERLSKAKGVAKRAGRATYAGGKKLLRGPSPENRQKIKRGFGKVVVGTKKAATKANKGLSYAQRNSPLRRNTNINKPKLPPNLGFRL